MGTVTQLRPKPRRRRRWPVILLAVAALGTGLYIWNPAVLLTAAPAEPDPLAGVRQGSLRVTLEADAVLVRREQVYRAPQAGTLRRLAAEGARVRVGGQVVAFAPGQSAAALEEVITTPVSGVVFYQTDGLEEVLTPEAVAGWGPEAFSTLPYPDTREIADGPVEAGEPLFKLVDDLSLEMLLRVSADSLSESQQAVLPGQEVELQVSGRDLPLTARVVRLAAAGPDLLVHLEAPLPSADALRLRRMRVSLLLAEYEGIILPRAAIDVEQGRTGVWIAQRGGYRFVPVRVLGGTADEVAVEGDVPPDAQVLTAPPPRNR
ncbi:HlyD family efflux transporter periplasmic adaptor subunit [Symbiobacterium thermophilum]|uniref:RND related barrel-sandwich hybrid domain-containing protein n=1 Tax=Symbiobacterium thermophilum TaxID=2734 RepID=A0A1Y2T7B3_SYMTR|nr:HlyD family efflux transporter periplasmic adaptor subunit [Symbiobacterium thermophilum]MBY6274885.1 hypothetical protein [Symbiobacterium thermophilum]OTA41676.1 MAG: hypothetical protein A6D92_04645 [Symbiobacterium thermophilum]